jgi:hypothetical protein
LEARLDDPSADEHRSLRSFEGSHGDDQPRRPKPEKVKELQAWIIDLAKQAATPLFLTELVRLGSATLRIFRTSAERMIEERRTGWKRLTP